MMAVDVSVPPAFADSFGEGSAVGFCSDAQPVDVGLIGEAAVALLAGRLDENAGVG